MKNELASEYTWGGRAVEWYREQDETGLRRYNILDNAGNIWKQMDKEYGEKGKLVCRKYFSLLTLGASFNFFISIDPSGGYMECNID